MSVEFIPVPTEELKKVLALVEIMESIRAKLDKALKHKTLLESLLPVAKRSRSLSSSLKFAVISNIGNEIDNLKQELAIYEELLKLLPKLCDNCNGKRSVDYGGSEGRRVCRSCDGTGFHGQGNRTKQIEKILKAGRALAEDYVRGG